MSDHRGPGSGLISPVLVGRDDVLALVERRWHEAREGRGHLLMITGEAGIGKTRILRELVDRIGGARLLTAAAFPRESDAPGGMLLNLADDLARGGEHIVAEALRERIAAESDDSGDVARRRRLLVGDLSRILESVLGEQVTLLLVEDAHWADEVSLETLARLVPVIRSAACLAVVTYRSDEAGPGSPLSPWRAQLLAQRRAEEARLGRLSYADVAEMARAIRGSDLAPGVIDVLVERSDGIPLHVEELLTAGADTVPDSIAESVRARTARLPVETREIMKAASVIGRSFDLDLLATVSHSPLDAVESALHDLSDEHLVTADTSGEIFVFRHALLCDAVYRAISPGRRRKLHAAVARESLARGLAEATISEHYERAHDADAAYRHALTGAHDASRRSAHREAVALYRRALRTASPTLEPRDRGFLHAEIAAELMAVDNAAESADHYVVAIDVYRAQGDENSAAALVPELMAARHLLGHGLNERADLAHQALARLGETSGGRPRAVSSTTTGDLRVRCGLLVALAAAYMLDRRLEQSASFAARAEELLGAAQPPGATRDAPDALALSLDSTLGSVLVFSGQSTEGWRRLESSIRRAESARLEQEAARAYRMMGSSASVLLDYVRAEQWLSRGIEYTAQVERWNDHYYLVAHLAHVRWAIGDWSTAEGLARRALADGEGMTTRITALHVLGYLATGLGQWREAHQYLEQSRVLAERMGELQRLSPSLWGLAELALAQRDAVTAAALCERALAASLDVSDAAYLIPFVVTGTRAHLAAHGEADASSWIERCAVPLSHRDLHGTAAALTHARALVVEARSSDLEALALLRQAEKQWVTLNRWWEGAAALVDIARVALATGDRPSAIAAARTARTRAEIVGARPLEEAAARVLDPPSAHGLLTDREFEVARLVASGATNRTIAEQLVIAPKTVSAHVEHILTKLGAARRAEIAAWVARNEMPVL